jgi:hypothetical protein
MTETNYTAFGIPMQQRSARRKLVVAAYLVLALICGLTIAFIRVAPYLYSYAMYATLAFSFVVFGGMGRRGLLKPFPNKPPRPEPPMVTVIQLHLQPEVLLAKDDSAWKNDERELSRRDLAHYRAYQPMSLALVILLCITAIGNHPWSWISLPVLLNVAFGVALVATVMYLTLPAAIILWTEPDIDEVSSEGDRD